MITKDGFSGLLRVGETGLRKAIHRLTENPFISRKQAGRSVASEAIENDRSLAKLCHSSLNPALRGLDQNGAGVASVFVRTGILQNPAVALGSQSSTTPSSLTRLLD